MVESDEKTNRQWNNLGAPRNPTVRVCGVLVDKQEVEYGGAVAAVVGGGMMKTYTITGINPQGTTERTEVVETPQVLKMLADVAYTMFADWDEFQIKMEINDE